MIQVSVSANCFRRLCRRDRNKPACAAARDDSWLNAHGVNASGDGGAVKQCLHWAIIAEYVEWPKALQTHTGLVTTRPVLPADRVSKQGRLTNNSIQCLVSARWSMIGVIKNYVVSFEVRYLTEY